MEHNVDEFVKNVLPGLLQGKSRCHAVFQTTRQVGELSPGPQDTGKPGLTAEITDGMSSTDVMFGTVPALFAGVPPWETPAVLDTKAIAEGMSSDLKTATSEGAQLILVKYVSLFGLDTDVRKLEEICERNQGLIAIAVVCDCGLERKRRLLSSLLESGKVHNLIVGNDCGGYGTMGRIYRGIVDSWPVAA